MPQIGPLEVLVVLMVALIVFGPEKMPDLARQVGRALAQFRKMASEVKDEFQEGFDFDMSLDDEPEPRADHPNLRARPEPVEGPKPGVVHEGMDPELRKLRATAPESESVDHADESGARSDDASTVE